MSNEQTRRTFLKLSAVGFTATASADLASALRLLPAAQSSKVSVVFITTDPDRDTGPVIKAWLAKFSPAFTGLTGTVAEVDDTQLMMQLALAVPDAPRGFDRAEHPDGTVEAPAACDGVGVGAGDKRGAAVSPHRADEISGRVPPHLKTGIAHPAGDPLSRAHVRLREHSARPARAVRVAKLRQRRKIGLEPRLVDRRHSDHPSGAASTGRMSSTPMICSTSASAIRSRVLDESGSRWRWTWKTAS